MRLQQILNKLVSKHTNEKDYRTSLATHTKPRGGLNRRTENGNTKIEPEGGAGGVDYRQSVFLTRRDVLA